MEGVALELYRRGREEAREELAEANARRGDLRTALQWANEERDRLREQLAAKHSECPDCAMYAERSARFAEQADQLMRERDELVAQRARMAEQIATLDRNAETFIEDARRMRRERDEAREEVQDYREQLRKLPDANRVASQDAYRRGAEAMREAAANALDMAGQGTLCDTRECERWGRYVRALPIPEES
jgi:chromosome segregation ATPase